MKTTTTIGMVAVLLAGCGEMTGDTSGTDGGGGGGGGSDVTGGTGGGTTSTTSIPWDGSPYLGFGYDGAPCDAQHAMTERVRSGDTPVITSLPIVAPVHGFITRVTVVHAIESVLGACGTGERTVLVSQPVKGAVPSSPPVHETIAWSSADVLGAPAYNLPGEQRSESVALGRDLADALEVQAGDVVHIGSLLDSEPICVLASSTMLDGEEPPQGHAFCAQGDTWGGCAPMPFLGATSWIAYVGWVDFAPY
jgi:hypothetical protein